MYAIGIDIGGMSIKAGLVRDGKIVRSDRKPTAPTPERAVDDIVFMIEKLLKESSLSLEVPQRTQLTTATAKNIQR